MQSSKISYSAQEKMVELAGACFWYWDTLRSFLQQAAVPIEMIARHTGQGTNKYQAMRNILAELQASGFHGVIETLASEFYKLNNAVNPDKLDSARAKQLLREFRALIGNDPIEIRVQALERLQRQADARQQIVHNQQRSARLESLNDQFRALAQSDALTAQQRGYQLEELVGELLRLNEFSYTGPYRAPGEQIDGHFRFEGFDYLIELKWTQSPANQADLSIFDGKIRGKAQSTRGLFISMTGFNENAIARFSGDSPRILLMDGRELMLVLGGHISVLDCMRHKVDSLVRRGEIYNRLA